MAAGWSEFRRSAADIAEAGTRLLAANEVAFLATVSSDGRPRLHPFVPRVVGDVLLAFIMRTSPKRRDLDTNGYYALHLMPGPEDEEVFFSGRAVRADSGLRDEASEAMGFATGVDDDHLLYELRIERALWTRWLDFGTPDHRPARVAWHETPGR